MKVLSFASERCTAFDCFGRLAKDPGREGGNPVLPQTPDKTKVGDTAVRPVPDVAPVVYSAETFALATYLDERGDAFCHLPP